MPGWFGMEGRKAEQVGEFILLEIGEAYYRERSQQRRTRVNCAIVDGIPYLDNKSAYRSW